MDEANKKRSLPKVVCLLAVGDFGRAVARHLKSLRDDVLEESLPDDSVSLVDSWPIARAYVITSSRPAPKLCGLLDRVCHAYRRPFVPLILDSKTLVLGPIVLPGSSSCWTCWSKRCLQHARWPAVHKTLLEYYSSDGNSGPEGYLEPLALLAAARVSQTLGELDSSDVAPSSVWQMDILTRKITTGTVVGVHGCPRCGLQRPEETRSVAALQEQLTYLWAGTCRGDE